MATQKRKKDYMVEVERTITETITIPKTSHLGKFIDSLFLIEIPYTLEYDDDYDSIVVTTTNTFGDSTIYHFDTEEFEFKKPE